MHVIVQRSLILKLFVTSFFLNFHSTQLLSESLEITFDSPLQFQQNAQPVDDCYVPQLNQQCVFPYRCVVLQMWLLTLIVIAKITLLCSLLTAFVTFPRKLPFLMRVMWIIFCY